jgi:hypothetical protein
MDRFAISGRNSLQSHACNKLLIAQSVSRMCSIVRITDHRFVYPGLIADLACGMCIVLPLEPRVCSETCDCTEGDRPANLNGRWQA